MLPFGIDTCTVFPTTFLEIAVCEKNVDLFANLLPEPTAFAHALIVSALDRTLIVSP